MILGLVGLASAAKADDCLSHTSQEDIRKELKVADDWDANCNSADSGRTLMVAMHRKAGGEMPRIVLLVKSPGGATARTQLTLGGPEASLIQAMKHDIWHVIVREEKIDGQDVIHVSTAASTEGEARSTEQIATFFRLNGDKLVHLWTGLDYSSREANGCYMKTDMKYKLTADGKLTRTSRSKAKVKDRKKMPPARAKTECVAAAPKTDTFPLDGAPGPAAAPKK